MYTVKHAAQMRALVSLFKGSLDKAGWRGRYEEGEIECHPNIPALSCMFKLRPLSAGQRAWVQSVGVSADGWHWARVAMRVSDELGLLEMPHGRRYEFDAFSEASRVFAAALAQHEKTGQEGCISQEAVDMFVDSVRRNTHGVGLREVKAELCERIMSSAAWDELT